MAQAMDTAGRGKRNGHARVALKARTHDVLEDFSELRKDMSRLAEVASKAAREEMQHVGQRLEGIGKELRTRASNGRDYAIEQIRERPAAALGVALGAGFLLGLLMSRR